MLFRSGGERPHGQEQPEHQTKCDRSLHQLQIEKLLRAVSSDHRIGFAYEKPHSHPDQEGDWRTKIDLKGDRCVFGLDSSIRSLQKNCLEERRWIDRIFERLWRDEGRFPA